MLPDRGARAGRKLHRHESPFGGHLMGFGAGPLQKTCQGRNRIARAGGSFNADTGMSRHGAPERLCGASGSRTHPPRSRRENGFARFRSGFRSGNRIPAARKRAGTLQARQGARRSSGVAPSTRLSRLISSASSERTVPLALACQPCSVGSHRLARVGGGLLLDRPHAPRAQEYDGAAASHVVEYCLVRRAVRPEPPHTCNARSVTSRTREDAVHVRWRQREPGLPVATLHAPGA
jgi:hypothetical protein